MGYKIQKIYVGSNQVRPKEGNPSYISDTLVAYYPFDGDILDHKSDYGISGTAHNLSVRNGTLKYSTSFESGKQAFAPDATGMYNLGCILYNQDSVFNFTTDFTVSLCFKANNLWTSSSSYYTTPIAQRGTNGFKWMIMVNSSRKLLFHGSAQYVSTQSISTGTRYNITCTVLNGTYYIYVNGTLNKSGSYSYSSGSSEQLTIGGAYYNSTYGAQELWSGLISEVIIDKKGWTSDMALQRAKDLGFAS